MHAGGFESALQLRRRKESWLPELRMTCTSARMRRSEGAWSSRVVLSAVGMVLS